MSESTDNPVRKVRMGPKPKEVPSVMVRIPGELKPAVEEMKRAWYALEKKTRAA